MKFGVAVLLAFLSASALAAARVVVPSLSNYYPEGDADRKFELWVSLKFVGPNFGLNTEDGKDRMVCDRFFLVDRNGRKYKGE